MALEVLEIEAAVRHGDAGDPGGKSLHRRGDGTRVQHVLAHVRAVVHARNDPVGALRHERAEREQDAIGRCAVDLECPVRSPMRPQRPVQRQRVRRAALLAVRSDHGDLADVGADVGEQRDAGREHAIVVRNQNPQTALSWCGHVAPATIRPACRAKARAMRQVSVQDRK